MPRLMKLMLPLLAIFALLGTAAPANAAKYGIQDDAKFFSPETVTQGEQIIKQIRAGDDRDVLVITYDKLPDDVQAKLTDTNKGKVFQDWADSVFTDNGVSGVLILITRHPGHLVSAVGNKTKLHTFTGADKTDLEHKMLALLKEKKHDEALLAGLNFIKDRMTANESRSGGVQSGAAPPVYPTVPVPSSNSGGFHVGGLLCVGIAILVIVALVIGAANRNRSGYGGAPPQGGYPPTYGGGGYTQGGYGGGGYQGGGGGGFGRGLLGGLLGGALGAWGYEKFNQPSNNPNSNSYPPAPTGGGNFGEQPDTSASGGSGGGDFDSSSSSDFSSSDSGGGGGDFGGGGGDSGGGGGGGDF